MLLLDTFVCIIYSRKSFPLLSVFHGFFVSWVLILWNSVTWHLTLYLLMWRIWWAPNNASWWQMGFNLAFKGLKCWMHLQGLYLESSKTFMVISCAIVQPLILMWEWLWLELLTFDRYRVFWYGSCSLINVGHSCNLSIVKLCWSCTYIFH
jgi:hypothetical protein